MTLRGPIREAIVGDGKQDTTGELNKGPGSVMVFCWSRSGLEAGCRDGGKWYHEIFRGVLLRWNCGVVIGSG